MEDNDYQKKSGAIRQLASLPADQFIDHLTTLHPHISQVAPNIAPHVFSAATNAVQFLNGKLPNAGNELLQDRSPDPSLAQKNAWLDLHKTVSDPTSVLEHVNQGTLNSHHMQALQTVYPDLHQEMSQKILEELGNKKLSQNEIPYQKRMTLSKFLGQPIDSTLTNQNMLAIMNSASQNTNSQAQGKPKGQSKPTEAQLDQIGKTTSLYQTPSQNREMLDKKT